MLLLIAEVTHVLAALVIMAEALNKIERVCPLAKGLTQKQRLIEFLKGAAWVSIALGVGGAIASPFLWWLDIPSSSTTPFLHRPPSFAEVSTMFGLAALVIRNRLKEDQ